MAEWNGNPSWTPKEQINGGQQFNPDDILSPEDFNALVENMQYLYAQGGDFEVNPYPIGSIYMSTTTTSPASLFGGSWTRIQDKFLVAAGKSYSLGATGGNTSHTHNLDSNGYAKIYMGSLPGIATTTYGLAMNHRSVDYYTATRAYTVPATGSATPVKYEYTDETTSTASTLGGRTESTSTLPPYQAVYVWRRVS